ncbi:MAG: hypothetical protein C3L26_12375 [Candidatus Sedimenticola endophacoides]|nr:MAG: hypothetical protein B0D94_00760 [Candidatus Sedimenticola endophacoides]PUD98465.1 MAG: hypothetical protein C3L26_12375 [Candidatus Sedimenticola endophacoides]
MKNLTVVSRSLCAAVLIAGVAAAPAQASPCKGMSDAECESSAQCRWVDGYTRGDGRKVNGYCRLQSSRKKDTLQPQSSGSGDPAAEANKG